MCVGGCVCFVCVVNRQRIDSNTREQHDDTTDVEEGSVTHLKATGLRESLFQLWFSIQSQKNISKIWKSGQVRLWSRNAGGGTVSASGLWINIPLHPLLLPYHHERSHPHIKPHPGSPCRSMPPCSPVPLLCSGPLH